MSNVERVKCKKRRRRIRPKEKPLEGNSREQFQNILFLPGGSEKSRQEFQTEIKPLVSSVQNVSTNFNLGLRRNCSLSEIFAESECTYVRRYLNFSFLCSYDQALPL
jgi:hypothetical protein